MFYSNATVKLLTEYFKWWLFWKKWPSFFMCSLSVLYLYHFMVLKWTEEMRIRPSTGPRQPQSSAYHLYLFFIVRFHYTGISPCSFHEKCSGFFNVHRVWLSYTRDRRLKVSSERLGNEDKAPCLRAQLPWLGFEPGTSALSVRGLNHSATAAPTSELMCTIAGDAR